MMNRVAYVTGVTIATIFLFGPVIRKQNIILRVAYAGLGGFAFYKHMKNSSDSIFDTAVTDVYKRYCIENGLNYRMYD